MKTISNLKSLQKRKNTGSITNKKPRHNRGFFREKIYLSLSIVNVEKKLIAQKIISMIQDKQLTAIIYCSIKQVNGNNFLKYRKIDNNDKAKAKFLSFAAKFPGAEYVNFYERLSKKFIERIYLK